MEYIIIAAIMVLMLIVIICGAVAYCAKVGRDARRQRHHAEAAVELATAAHRRCDELEEYISTLREEAAQNDAQSVKRDERDEAAKERERQYENLMNAKVPDLLNLGGDR